MDSVVAAHGLHMESFQTRDWTHVPCIGRQILNYWTTSKVPALTLDAHKLISIVLVLLQVRKMRPRLVR